MQFKEKINGFQQVKNTASAGVRNVAERVLGMTSELKKEIRKHGGGIRRFKKVFKQASKKTYNSRKKNKNFV